MTKNFECSPFGCGTFFTIPVKINPIGSSEHMAFCIEKGYEYQEAVIKKDGADLVLCCPKCGKEAYRKVGGWIDGLN